MKQSARQIVIPHDSAYGHVTGSSEYVDDRPVLPKEVHVVLLGSPIAHGRIKESSFEKVRGVEGVIEVFTAKDFKHNTWGTIFQDQPLLAESIVSYVGEPIALVAVESRECQHAVKAAASFDVEAKSPILTIDEARRLKKWIGPERKIETGDVEKALKKAPHRIEGVTRIAGQDHFYLESQAAIAYPVEGGRLEIHSSTQHPTEVQHVVAKALGLHYHDVVCTVKRMGGGFGGKESQASPFAAYCALVAHRLRRPARLVLTKDEDMLITGKRNPFEIHWTIGFDSEGKFLALDAQLFSDGGAYADLSTAIMERAMLHIDNAYYFPNARIRGQVCLTHTPPNTAFRGFGGPKGMIAMESMVDQVAAFVKKDALDIRKQNVYRNPKANKTPYGQIIQGEILPKLFDCLEKTSQYRKRRKAIQIENAKKTELVKGLAITPVKFGISFTTRFLNQASALVNVHMDGTIQVSTGATEMGQGVNTKIAQVVAERFGVPFESVRVMPTSTEKNPNTSPTAASSGADLNGLAALNASDVIRGRLAQLFVALTRGKGQIQDIQKHASGQVNEIILKEKHELKGMVFENGFVFRKSNPKRKLSFSELTRQAWLHRIPLSATGFYKYPEIHFNKVTGRGKPFRYFTNGVAATEVSLNRQTGELKVVRSDLLMDLGRPLNVGIDRGQVTGAFIQGMGWLTTERLFYDQNGKLISHSPSTYKIPSIQDIPRVFNVDFFVNQESSQNLRGSKAVGEPPLMLAISVWMAIKDALREAGVDPRTLPVPATQEEILMRLPEMILE